MKLPSCAQRTRNCMFAFQRNSEHFQTSAFQWLRNYLTTTLLCGNTECAKMAPRHQLFPHIECGELLGGDLISLERDALMAIPLVVTTQCQEDPHNTLTIYLEGWISSHMCVCFHILEQKEAMERKKRLSGDKMKWINTQRTQKTSMFTSYLPQNG